MWGSPPTMTKIYPHLSFRGKRGDVSCASAYHPSAKNDYLTTRLQDYKTEDYKTTRLQD